MPTDRGSTEKIEKKSVLFRVRHLFCLLTDKLGDRKNEKKNRIILLFSTSFLLTLLIVPNQHFVTSRFNAGDIAATDIKATQGYLLENQILTEKKRDAAKASVPFTYNYYPNKPAELTERFSKVFSMLEGAEGGSSADTGEKFLISIADVLGCSISAGELDALKRSGSANKVLPEIGRILSVVFERRVIADRRLFASDKNHGIVIIDASTGKIVDTENFAATASTVDLKEAGGIVRNMRIHVGGTSGDSMVLKGLLVKALQPNMVFDRDATEKKKREAAEAVSPVLFQVKRGEMIVREGERISEEHALKLNKILEAREGISKFFSAIGIFGLILVIFYFPYRFSQKNIRKFNPSAKDLLLLAFVTVAIFLLLRIAINVSSALGMIFPHINSTNYFYLLPFAVGPMLVRIILNSEVALVYCMACAPLLGIMFNNSLTVVVYALLGGVIGAHGVRQCKDRGTIYTAGLKVSVVNMAIAVPFQILNDSMLTMQIVYAVIFACVGGILNSLIVSGTTPVIESVFQYTTDIKLLELSNLNSPVLRELMIRAPGTYHHSVMVGNLVEAAAEAINANPLLGRVAAYYHDIGKVSKPIYFIENIRSGENKHDKLTPNMSALILISHVKEGVELAKEKRLGRPIIDIIRQHHGTALIKYFYQKAKSNEATESQTVDELDFRYPGPKPQTREAGLVMLADCVEAASKTLTDPTPARIQGMVQKIINNIFIDGQLEECELSLKSLHEIAKSFNRVLSGIYHQRIDYPEPVYKVNERKKNGENTDREQAKTSSDSSPKSEKGSGEDIKRLGISR
ncbi:MAG TPA: HDIG domain-containing protein [Geobacteraceae bacterium]|nr:HDIG domain-containing protein [Geobacteraceae bacterium]